MISTQSHKAFAGILIIAMASISGCATKQVALKIDPVIAEADVSALEELKSISIEARNELRLLAKAQQAKNEKVLTKEQQQQSFFQATYTPPGFEKLVDFHYVGEVNKAIEALSMVSGYKLITPDGKTPPVSVWVNISIENQPLNEALKEIGMQAGDKVRLEIHPSAKLMRLIYK